MIYLHENGVTVVASDEAKRGKVYELNGEKYYVARGVSDIKKMIDSREYPLSRVITSKLTSLNGLFQIQGGYRQLAVPDNFNDDITNWDTSNVLSMDEVFSGWPTFNQDISNWDTSKVESMYGMFKSSKYQGSYYMGPTSFNQDISKWDVSNVKNMSEMFLGATSFNQDISKWDVSNVENMNHMFSGATSFNQPLGNWDVSKVEKMEGMFSDIVSIGIVAFVGTLEYTRAGSTSFNQDISCWDVSNVKNMIEMFSGATSFNQPLGNWDVSNVENMSQMFSGATSFNQDISKWDVSNVKNMLEMFSGATSFNQDISKLDVSNVSGMSKMFLGATSFNQPLGNWDVSNVYDMSSMFCNATSFNQDLNEWNTSSLSKVDNMFYGATSFNAPIGNWNIKSITNMENMFREATAFNQDISSWDVSNVIQMKGLFQDASSFNQDLTNWKLNEKLPKSRTVFQGATAFNIKEFNPFLNIKPKKRAVDASTANLSSEDKKTISKVKKLLKERDLDKIDLGLELLISLNNDELYESLLHECKIDNSNKNLITNKVFTGSGPAQPFLNYALINVIANAPEHVNKDESLQLKNITEIDTSKFNLKHDYTRFSRFIPFEKFHSLQNLKVDFSDFQLEDINLNDVFKNENITSLKVLNVEGSLKWLNNFTQLKTLDFSFSSSSYGLEIEHYESFYSLENLEFIKLHADCIDDIDFLHMCKNLKKLEISTGRYSSAKDLKNINALSKLEKLEHFKIDTLKDDTNIEALGECKSLKKLVINVENSDIDLDLSMLKTCKHLDSIEINGIDEFEIYGKIQDILGLNQLRNLKNLLIGNNASFKHNLISWKSSDDFPLMGDLNDNSDTNKPVDIESEIYQNDKVDNEVTENINDEISSTKDKLTPEDKKAFSEIKKLISSRDFEKIDEGVDKLVSINRLELFETLLKDCKFFKSIKFNGETTELITNNFFKGSGPAQPYLNYAIFSVIVNTPKEAEIHDSIKVSNIISFDTEMLFRHNYDVSYKFPPLNKLTSLISLKINLRAFDLKNINLEDVFKNDNVVNMEVLEPKGSLSWLNNFCDVKSLKIGIDAYDEETNNHESFNSLVNLEELEINCSKLENIDFLNKCVNIRKLKLSLGAQYSSPSKTKNLNALNHMSELIELEIFDMCKGNSEEEISNFDLSGLLSCKNLKKIVLDPVPNPENTIKHLKNCNSLETLYLKSPDDIKVSGKITGLNGLKSQESLKEIRLGNVIINGIDEKVFIN